MPLLQERGLDLFEFPAINFGLTAYPGLLLKAKRVLLALATARSGRKAIDFFMRVLGLSFHDARRQITGP